MFEKFEARLQNSGQSSRLPEGDFGAALRQAGLAASCVITRLIDAFSRYYEFDYHVFLQPEVVFEDTQPTGSAGRCDQGDHGAALRRAAGRDQRRAFSRFPELFAMHQVPYTDLGSLADEAGAHGQLYMDDCHLMPEGAQAVAGGACCRWCWRRSLSAWRLGRDVLARTGPA